MVGSPRAANGANAAVDEMEFATARRALGGWQGRLWRAAAAVFVLWHLWIVLIDPVDPTVARAVHVFLGAALGFALFAPRAITGAPGATVPWYDGLLILPCLLIPAHYVLDADGIELRSFAGPNTADLLAAGFGIVLVLEFARRTAGPVMPLIAAAFIAYCFAGPFLPGILFHRGIALDQALVELFGNNGLLGTIVQVSASYIIMFVVFATFLQSSGAGEYFNDFALALVGRLRGGPAKVTVVSGILFGTISGSSVANVVASGSFTIPMMRRVGYDRATAAAVEATSSTGGQLTPPVMGAGAFIMAEVLGVAYAEIALAGVIPALLFYVANYVHCDLHARKAGLRGVPREELPRWAHLARHAYMAAPLLLLVWMLVAGFSPFRAAAWGIAATLAIMAGTALAHRLGVRGEGAGRRARRRGARDGARGVRDAARQPARGAAAHRRLRRRRDRRRGDRRDRRGRAVRQHPAGAGGRLRLPRHAVRDGGGDHPRHGGADDGGLRDRRGGGGAGADAVGRGAAGGAHVHLLLRGPVGDHAAGGARLLRRGVDGGGGRCGGPA